MGIFAFIGAMVFAAFVGGVIRDDQIEDNCNQVKVIEIKSVKYSCVVLDNQKLNWTPSKAK